MLAEKYRPRKLDEIVGQDYAVKILKIIVDEYRKRGTKPPHMLFYGKQGTGKTSTAYALANELNIPLIELNASDERGIEVIRGVVKQHVKTYGKKIIFLDEADNLTVDSQYALRRIMEDADRIALKTNNESMVIFILTANYPHKIIPPLRSRTLMIPFNPIPDKLIAKKMIEIIRAEGVKLRSKEELEKLKKIIYGIVKYCQGDMRKVMNILDGLIPVMKHEGITDEIVRMYGFEDYATQLFSKVFYEHRFDEAYRLLVDNIVSGKIEPYSFLHQLLEMIMDYLKENEDSLDYEKKKYLLSTIKQLSIAEQNMLMGGSPIIQLSSILSMLYLAGLVVNPKQSEGK